MSRWVVAALVLLAVVGLGFRLPQLALRPMHNDEGVNAMKFRALWVDNNYKYDPNEFHGPTLPYFTLPFAFLSGTRDFNQLGEATYRVVPALFGVGVILLMVLLPDFGRAETLWAAALITISPAMVFYSRYYIHEMLLVFFTALAFFASWRYAGTGKLVWALIAGIGLGLMVATKETFVFAVAALVLAIASSAAWTRLRGTYATEPSLQWRGKWSHVVGWHRLAALAAVALSLRPSSPTRPGFSTCRADLHSLDSPGGRPNDSRAFVGVLFSPPALVSRRWGTIVDRGIRRVILADDWIFRRALRATAIVPPACLRFIPFG